MNFVLTISVGNKIIEKQDVSYALLKEQVNEYIDEITIADIESGDPIKFEIEIIS